MCRSLLQEFGARNVSLIGNELHHSCVLPFGLHRHGDQKPSASINIDKMVASCFVCGGGSLMWWVATCRGTGGTEAKRWIREHTGVDGTSLAALVQFFDEVYSPKDNREPPIPTYSDSVLDPWRLIHPYLTEIRKIPVKTLIQFRVGFNPDNDRVVIPHFWKGKLVGWVTRRIANDHSLRYQYTPSFPKKQTIYNYQEREAPVIVESQMSVLRQYEEHHAIEATFGASVSKEQIRLLGCHPRVYLFFDNDEAGYQATKFLGEALSIYTDVRVVCNPYEADAGDLDPKDFRAVIADSLPFSIWKRPTSLVPYAPSDSL